MGGPVMNRSGGGVGALSNSVSTVSSVVTYVRGGGLLISDGSKRQAEE
jgi:hypothetical protein